MSGLDDTGAKRFAELKAKAKAGGISDAEAEEYKALRAKATVAPETPPVAAPPAEDDRSLIDKAADYFLRPYPTSLDDHATFADNARSALTGITWGGADEAAAAVEAPFRAMGDGTSVGEAYDRGLAELQPAYDHAIEVAPQQMYASGMLTGGTEKTAAQGTAKFLPKVAKGVAKGVGMGTATGTLMAHPGERIKNGLIGGAFGGIVNGGVTAATELMQPAQAVYRYLRNKAADLGAKAGGVRGTLSNMVQKEGIKDAAGVRQFGRDMLDGDLIPFAGSKDAVLKRAEEKAAQLGPAVDSYFEQGDKLTTPAQRSDMFNDALVSGQYVLDDLDDVAVKFTGKADDLMDSWATARDRGAGFLDTRKMNTSANKLTNHSAGEVPMREEVFKDVKRAMRGKVLDNLETVLPEGEVEGLKAVNKVFSTAKKAAKFSSNAATREVANKGTSLTGAIEAQNMGGVAGFVWPRVKSVLEQRGPAAGAITLDAIAKYGSKFSPMLQDAAKRGPMALAVAHYLAAQKDPDYRTQMASVKEDDDN